MSQAGIIGMRSAADDILTLGATLDQHEWSTPSAAGGWSVGDVIVHVGCLLELVQAAVGGESAPEGTIEALNNIQVMQRQDWDSAKTLAYIQRQIDRALPVFASIQQPPMALAQIPMLDLGSYPLHAVADMFTFDMVTHLRYDILAPRGPINRQPAPLDEEQLGPSVSWLLGGIPKMQPELASHISAPLILDITGPGAQRVIINADGHSISVRPSESHNEDAAAILSSASADFLAWSTTRLPWRPVVTISGDEAAATAFLDALNLI